MTSVGRIAKTKKRKKSKRIVCTDILRAETTQRKRIQICMQYVEKQRKIDRKNIYMYSIYSGSSLSIQFQLYLQTYSSITHRFWKETVQFKTMLKFLHIYSTQYIYICIYLYTPRTLPTTSIYSFGGHASDRHFRCCGICSSSCAIIYSRAYSISIYNVP